MKESYKDSEVFTRIGIEYDDNTLIQKGRTVP
jgi:hypothetical protein